VQGIGFSGVFEQRQVSSLHFVNGRLGCAQQGDPHPLPSPTRRRGDILRGEFTPGDARASLTRGYSRVIPTGLREEGNGEDYAAMGASGPKLILVKKCV
jgi:hypothetical protein